MTMVTPNYGAIGRERVKLFLVVGDALPSAIHHWVSHRTFCAWGGRGAARAFGIDSGQFGSYYSVGTKVCSIASKIHVHIPMMHACCRIIDRHRMELKIQYIVLPLHPSL